MEKITELSIKCTQVLSEIQKLEKTINHQRQIKEQEIIPEKYKPQKLDIAQPNSNKLQQEFESQYTSLFFNHLSKVLLENEIGLEIKKSKLQNLQQRKLLRTLSLPTQQL